ncbi:hypothetical protein DT73_11715 [Mangrovibacter sp. MFB070]|uniref:hypothetical protein n=1 Tax=Mangrovibacter sp. MFB070 TaxID=1224318 RepID=UPI0004D93AAB|nr:hypothetical protein [Mangrovibacter sp. MFB070]KEA52753.1 hypothetical protein DT73_11715 [Mangrovibacter sp. MFB070]
MENELPIDLMKILPEGVISELGQGALTRLNDQLGYFRLTINQTSNRDQAVLPSDKTKDEHLLQETRKSADERFY